MLLGLYFQQPARPPVTTLGQVPVGTRAGTRTRGPCAEQVVSAWLLGLRVYLGVILVGNLIWETLHLPLYTIWTTGTLWEQAFAVVHCTFGDLLIAVSTLTLPSSSLEITAGRDAAFGWSQASLSSSGSATRPSVNG